MSCHLCWLIFVLKMSHHSFRQHWSIKQGVCDLCAMSEQQGMGQPSARFQSAMSQTSSVPSVCCSAQSAEHGDQRQDTVL